MSAGPWAMALSTTLRYIGRELREAREADGVRRREAIERAEQLVDDAQGIVARLERAASSETHERR